MNNSMTVMLAAGGAAFAVAAAAGPAVIKTLRRLKFGQKILEDGPTWHMNKQNTPTMGGFIFIAGMAAAVAAVMFLNGFSDPRPNTRSSVSLVFGAIGFVDDYTKVKKKRNKGLTAMQKLLLQIAAAPCF